MCVWFTVQRGTVFVLYYIKRHCVCIAQSRRALFVGTAQFREAMCV